MHAEGESLITDMQTRIAKVTAKVAGRDEPCLAFIEWIDPPMSGGHWMPELIDAAGGINLSASAGPSRRGSHGTRSLPPTPM